MTRVRRRQAHRNRLATLKPWERWCIEHGDKSSSTFESEAAWQETYEAVKDAIMASLDDPATQFRGFWRYDADVPDELRADLHRYGHVLMPEPMATEYQRDYEALIEARRAWLHERGYLGSG